MEPDKTESENTQKKAVEDLTTALRAELLTQQDPVYALVGGLSAAILGAVLWAIITVSTKHQIGYMAIGMGLLAGFTVRLFGAGIDRHFGIIGAFFALLGCALGNLLSQVGFIADAQSLTYFETITLLNFSLIKEIYVESFSPMDIVFYGIAGYEGYKFAFRKVDDELELAVAAGKVAPPAFARFRLPLVIILFILLSVGGFIIGAGSSGAKTFYYESGPKMSTGQLVNGKENGFWEAWWENGKQRTQGFYVDGRPDSLWKYFNEEGVLFRTVSFKSGVEHGVWNEYYPSGAVRGTGKYVLGRQTGPWTYSYENGTPKSRGGYLLDLLDGTWETFYENGKATSKGSYAKGIQTGLWTLWNEDGSKLSEIEFVDGNAKILNTWTEKGVLEIGNGNGFVKSFSPDGKLIESGNVKDGYRTGIWIKNYNDGKKQEEGAYKEGKYYVSNSWSPDGRTMVVLGEGTLETQHEDGSLDETGPIQKGLRSGKWTAYYMAGNNISSESVYEGGKLNGKYSGFYEDGKVKFEGTFRDDKRTGEWKWFTANETIESTVTYKDGKKDGQQLFYDDNGVVLRTEVYNNGELVESKLGPEI